MIGESPWSVPFRLSEVARGPVAKTLEADEKTRKTVARYLGLVSIESLTADLTIRPWLDGAEIQGRLDAELTYTCSVSAEAFPDRLSGEVSLRVLPAGSQNAPQEDTAEELELDPEADDPPDMLDGDTLDLGGYVVEHLSLELDPFPRKPGATFEPPVETEPLSPFAVLRVLKKDDAPE